MLGDGRIYEAIITPGYEQVVPDGFELKNYPNPFNVSTTIVYELSTAINVQITVADVLGREVAVLVNGSLSSILWHRGPYMVIKSVRSFR